MLAIVTVSNTSLRSPGDSLNAAVWLFGRLVMFKSTADDTKPPSRRPRP